MSDDLAPVSVSLNLLRSRIVHDDADGAGIAQVLRALQRQGVSQVDLQVQVERIRAANDATNRLEEVEARCLDALDLLSGVGGPDSLRWDAAEMARHMLPVVLTHDAIQRAVEPALARSDMLPPRTVKVNSSDVATSLFQEYSKRLSAHDVVPERADFFRMPKASFTTRPAALLAPQDRMSWEALANMIEPALDAVAPRAVVWPRSRVRASYTDFSRAPSAWDGKYVVRTDVEGFYESVDHSLLAVALSETFSARSHFTQVVEAFLDCVMGSPIGLPQGPEASDIFASAFLLLVDRRLERDGIVFARYADDYAISVESMSDGRRKIETLETYLREIGLRLQSEKTRVVRRSNYSVASVDRVSPRIVALRDRLREITVDNLRHAEDSDYVEETLRELGADEEVLWDLLYHRNTSIDDVIEELSERINPTLAESYRRFVGQESASLKRRDFPRDFRTARADLDESLLYLAGARVLIDSDHLVTLLTWFPELAPTVAAYARALFGGHRSQVRALLWKCLEPSAFTDWVQAWACFAIESSEGIVDLGLQRLLGSIASSSSFGPLARSGAARALASARHLAPDTWAQVLRSASAPMASELYLDVVADPQGYPDAIPVSLLGLPPGEL